MSHYTDQIAALTEWFKIRLAPLGQLEITERDYKAGTDGVPEPFAGVVAEALDYWSQCYRYELSYNQLCVAFFMAARALGKLTILHRHEMYHLNTRVCIHEIRDDCGMVYKNVPGTIIDIVGDDFYIVLDGTLRKNARGQNCCFRFTIDELDKELSLAN